MEIQKPTHVVDIVPTTSGIARDWCLYEDAKAIEIELRERQTDNQKDLTRWINERLDVTRKRYEVRGISPCGRRWMTHRPGVRALNYSNRDLWQSG